MPKIGDQYDQAPVDQVPSDIPLAYLVTDGHPDVYAKLANNLSLPEKDKADFRIFYVAPEYQGFEYLLVIWDHSQLLSLVWGLEPLYDPQWEGAHYVIRHLVYQAALRTVPCLLELDYRYYVVSGRAYSTNP